MREITKRDILAALINLKNQLESDLKAVITTITIFESESEKQIQDETKDFTDNSIANIDNDER